jgi:sulfur carrier protein ThiS
MDVSVLTGATSAADDSVLLYDLTATAARKTTVEELLNPLKLTAAAAVASGDIVILHDLTAPTIASSTTVEELLNPVNLTAAAAVAEDDIVIVHDLTAPTIASSTTVAGLVSPANFTAEAASDDADSIIIFDNSAGAVRSMTRANFLSPALSHAYSLQAAAATADVDLFIAPAAGVISAVSARAGTTAAAGEDMAIDVEIGGTTCLTAAIVLDDAAGVTVVAGVVDAAANVLAAGDLVEVTRVYTAGGGATPMADTFVSVFFTAAI